MNDKKPHPIKIRNQSYVKHYNIQTVLRVLEEFQPVSRTEMVRLTEMSPTGGRKVHCLAKRRMEAELPIEKVGAELRGMMSWLKK